MEEKQNLLVVIEVLTEDRDNAVKEAEELRKERENILSHSSLSSEFTLQELAQATENFSDSLKLGEGGYGPVYKGTLRGMSVAIKKLNPNSMQGVSQFKQEIAILSQIRHPHLVTLIGSCSEASALVYEFLSNGSLESRLECSNINTAPLTWQIRTRIIGEICLALIFLHSCKPHLVIHGDLNPNNILLDANLVSKLADFGISHLVKQPNPNITALYRTLSPGGTYAYSDPEYMRTGELTPKSDVYSLGILILRLLTGTNPVGIVKRVDDSLKSGHFHSIIDGSAADWPFDQAKKLAEIGLSCAQMSRSLRPDLVSGIWLVIEPLMKAASLAVEENHIPHHFMCPIYQDVMKDPHLAADGFTYEAEAIKQWLNRGHNTSPMTNLVLPNHDLIPNHVLRSAIQEWLEHNPQRP
ncbi:hypothetical protein LUZ60_012355 [Juncus effusus]|nr:hypothetical protein LUZ60_012355 [Juncus effusus]